MVTLLAPRWENACLGATSKREIFLLYAFCNFLISNYMKYEYFK